jgi:hypothetical protein
MIVPGQVLAQHVKPGMSVSVTIDTRAGATPDTHAVAAR